MHMRCRAYGLVVFCSALLAASACGKSNPTSPSSQTASVVAPRSAVPANAAQIPNLAQPVTLIVQNAIVTQPGGTTYTFEVATDAAFATKVQTKDGVAEGSSGQTSVKLDNLAADKDYYWHVRATAGGTVGVFGTAYKFTIGPAIVINAPTPVVPANGASTSDHPTLAVTNATRSGPAGAIVYRFDISSSATFATVTVTGTVPEGRGQTSFTPSTALAANTTFYWRATAIDQTNSISGPPSPTQSFTTSLAIDLAQVILSYPGTPSDVASWPQTATITVVEQDGNPGAGGPMCIGFSTSDYWPSTGFFGDPTVPVYANQWYFANIDGQWYGGPGEYLRSDRPSVCKTGQSTQGIGPDGGWTNPMRSWTPKLGELVGYMISTPARAGLRTINERSNIVVQPWFDSSLSRSSAGPARKK
jgi:hypothetical protein